MQHVVIIDKDTRYKLKMWNKNFKFMKQLIVYTKCVRAGGDTFDCMFPERKFEIPEGYDYQEEMYPFDELLAQMSENEQRQVVTSITNAQARLTEEFSTEIEELGDMFR